MFGYLIGALCIEVISYILVIYGYQNLFLIYIILLLQLFIFSRYFISIIKSIRVINIIKYISVLILVGIFGILIFDPFFFKTLNPVAVITANIPIICYSVYCLALALTEKEIVKYSLINFGIFIYLSSSTIVFSSGDLLLDMGVSIKQFDYLYIFNNIIYIVFIILIFINTWNLSQERSLQ